MHTTEFLIEEYSKRANELIKEYMVKYPILNIEYAIHSVDNAFETILDYFIHSLAEAATRLLKKAFAEDREELLMGMHLINSDSFVKLKKAFLKYPDNGIKAQ